MSGPVPPIEVVIVAYGPPGPLGGALAALGGRFPVTVVDNSSDPTTAALAGQHGAHYLDPGHNVGFAAGVNRALDRLPPAADVLLLNPDARIEPDALARLQHELQGGDRLACVAPAHVHPGDGSTAPSTWAWHTPLRPWAEAIGLGRRPPRRAFLSGAVLLLSGPALAAVGPFDERFFMYAEEEDWQRRALALGLGVRHCDGIVAVHAAGSTDTDPQRLQLRLHSSTERFVRKWYGRRGWVVYRAGVVVGQTSRAVIRRGGPRRRAWRLARLYLLGPDRCARRVGVLPDARRAGAAPAFTPARTGRGGRAGSA